MEIDGKRALITEAGKCLVWEEEGRSCHVFASKEAAEDYYKHGPVTKWIGDWQIVSMDTPLGEKIKVCDAVRERMLTAHHDIRCMESGIKDMCDGTVSCYCKIEVVVRHGD